MKLESCSAPPQADRRSVRLLMPAGRTGNFSGLVNGRGNAQGSRRCGLLQCRKLECNLASHRHFAAASSYRVRLRGLLPATFGSGIPKQRSFDNITDHSALRIERLITDGIPALPFKHQNSSVFRELAHHYFSCQIDRLIQLYSPHLDPRKYKSTMMDHALSNDVF